MKLSTRLFLLVGCLLGALFITNSVSVYSMNRIGEALVEIAEEDIPLSNTLSEVTILQLEQSLELERAFRLALEFDANHPKFKQAVKRFSVFLEKADKALKEAQLIVANGVDIAHSQETAKKFMEIEQQLIQIESAHKVFNRHGLDFLQLLQVNTQGNIVNDNLVKTFNGIEQEERTLIEELEELLFDIEQFTAKAALKAESEEKRSIMIIAVLFVVATILASFSAWLLLRKVNQQMGRDPNCIMEFAERVANGNLQPMGIESESNLTGVFAAMVAMRDKLTTVVESIKDSVNNVNVGITEITQGNNNLSQRTESQSADLEQTTSSLDRMSSMVMKNADNARHANTLAKSARGNAEKGGEVVKSAIGAMSEISESSKKIVQITNVIDDIAFQTNLLALNASVEAARAGDQGRGFAVVASEVRNLAQRSAVAAKEIKQLIQESVKKIDDGSRLVDQSGETLNEIVDGAKKVSDLIAEIADLGREQASGIEMVTQSVCKVGDMTQQNAALVEQVAASSEHIGTQASELQGSVSYFKTGHDESLDAEQQASSDADMVGLDDGRALPQNATYH